MIVGVHGNLGTGKTALLARLAMHFSSLCEECSGVIDTKNIIPVFWEEGFEPPRCDCEKPMSTQIHANFRLNLPNVHYVHTLDDLEKVYHGVAVYDELWTWIDSRVSAHSDLNLSITGLLHKSRKRGYNILYEAKLDHLIDRRIRELTDYVLMPEKYIEQDGYLEKIEQHLLYPLNLKPYLDRIWIVVDELTGTQLMQLHPRLFQFPLSDVVDMYDTREEVEMLGKHPGLPEGMKKESEFGQFLLSLFPQGEILHGTLSRGWDVVLKNNGSSAAYDVVSVRTDNKAKGYFRLDIRGKHIKDMLKTAQKSNLKPYWAFKLDGKWMSIPMVESHTLRSTLSCKLGKEITPAG